MFEAHLGSLLLIVGASWVLFRASELFSVFPLLFMFGIRSPLVYYLLRTPAASHRRTTERISKKPSETEWVGESGGPPVKLRRSSSQRS